MMKDTMELIPQPQELDLIPLDHTARQIIARGRHKRIRHKRSRRDKEIMGWAIVSGLLFAIVLIQWGIIYILQAGPI